MHLRSLQVFLPCVLSLSFGFAPIVDANTFNSEFMSSCIQSFTASYRESSGKNPPEGLARKYCNCALASINSGNSPQVAMANCIKIYTK